jgi:hypothetical protein
LLANLPGFSVAAEEAAREIRSALVQRQLTCTIGFPAKLLIHAEALLPETTHTLMQFANHFVLPGPGSEGEKSGKRINPKFDALFQAMTSLGRLAANAYNQ